MIKALHCTAPGNLVQHIIALILSIYYLFVLLSFAYLQVGHQ